MYECVRVCIYSIPIYVMHGFKATCHAFAHRFFAPRLPGALVTAAQADSNDVPGMILTLPGSRYRYISIYIYIIIHIYIHMYMYIYKSNYNRFPLYIPSKSHQKSGCWGCYSCSHGSRAGARWEIFDSQWVNGTNWAVWLTKPSFIVVNSGWYLVYSDF